MRGWGRPKPRRRRADGQDLLIVVRPQARMNDSVAEPCDCCRSSATDLLATPELEPSKKTPPPLKEVCVWVWDGDARAGSTDELLKKVMNTYFRAR